TLVERQWIRIIGHRDVPGRPALYATTRDFLDYFNLKSLDQLPQLAELRDLDLIGSELDLRPEVAEGGEEEQEEALAGDPVVAQPLQSGPTAEGGSVTAKE
ncbi:MAG: SMC-Scp complex subunit ScpB, partial [Gammaproteobacteria bacterium]|nr:SMC-Scp complex subunit ScpB [Gammaproteobacteria bacterium]